MKVAKKLLFLLTLIVSFTLYTEIASAKILLMN